ncbi:triosephosphate isomerase [mine drainage metagenome]|uniref:Triosephosphate isomerase n=1 Tax=mine drainage metagenome TaxID=410659 RepID=T1AL82_9ZZZZ
MSDKTTRSKDSMLIINCKHYKNAVGERFENFFAQLPGSKTGNGWEIHYAIGTYDLHLAKHFPDKSFFAQHVDPNGYGAFTGRISMELLIDSGIKGSLINHSEFRLGRDVVERAIAKARNMEFDLVVCAENLDEVSHFAQSGAPIVAYEPPELIGGNISVSSEKPDIIEKAANICEKSDALLIVGAGIKTGRDIFTSLKLGAVGGLVASGVVLASNPADAITSLINI